MVPVSPGKGSFIILHYLFFPWLFILCTFRLMITHGKTKTSKMAGLDVPKFVFIWFQRFLFIVAGALPHKTTFWQTSIEDQLVVKILLRLDWIKITLKGIEKYMYGLQKALSRHLKSYQNGFFLSESPHAWTENRHKIFGRFLTRPSLPRARPTPPTRPTSRFPTFLWPAQKYGCFTLKTR